MPGLVLLLALAAHAGTPVLYTGLPEQALARVRRDGRLKADDVQLVRLHELAPGVEPYILNGAAPTPCRPSTMAAVEEAVGQAEAVLGDTAAATAILEKARMNLECLIEPIQPSVAARLFYLRGFLLWRGGVEEAAEASFYRALLFDPELRWDRALGGPRASSAWAGAQVHHATAPSGWLRFVPDAVHGYQVWIDGRPAPIDLGRVELKPGLHLVQIYSSALKPPPMVAAVEAGVEGAIVFPFDLSETLFSRLDDAQVRMQLALLLRQRWPEEPAWVVGNTAIWRYTPRDGGWELIGEPGKEAGP